MISLRDHLQYLPTLPHWNHARWRAELVPQHPGFPAMPTEEYLSNMRTALLRSQAWYVGPTRNAQLNLHFSASANEALAASIGLQYNCALRDYELADPEWCMSTALRGWDSCATHAHPPHVTPPNVPVVRYDTQDNSRVSFVNSLPIWPRSTRVATRLIEAGALYAGLADFGWHADEFRFLWALLHRTPTGVLTEEEAYRVVKDIFVEAQYYWDAELLWTYIEFCPNPVS